MVEQEKVNILMVDDQPAKLLSYEAVLNELGENLIQANSGRSALEILLKMDIGVVLMDVSMPDLDGFELAEIIHQHPRFRKTAIIFISAVHMSDVDRLRGYQRGAVDYIAVPVIPELLRAKVSVFAELHRKTRQLEALNLELRRLSNSLITMQDEERRRIARELHDGLGQDLVVIKMIVDGMLPDQVAPGGKLGPLDLSVLVDNAIQQVRSMSHLLHPPLLDEVGLHSALQGYSEGLTKRSGIDITIDLQPPDFPRLAPELETAVFRIVQEALTNVFRHASAQKGWVTVTKDESRVVVTVRDNGKGIPDPVAEFRPNSVGIGISGMRQRVKEFGGEFRLRNACPGTLLEVVIPIAAVAPQAQIVNALPR